MYIVFIGPPGAGKGTQAKGLASAFGVAHLSTGDMLRAAMKNHTDIGRRVEPYMTGGQFVPDEAILELIVEHLASPQCEKGYMLDGFPRKIVQAEAFDELSFHRGTPLDAVVELHVPEEELLDRLSHRGRVDDTPKIIRQRLIDYHEETEPLLEYYGRKGLLKTVDGSGSVDEVQSRIRALLEPYHKQASTRLTKDVGRSKDVSPGTTSR